MTIQKTLGSAIALLLCAATAMPAFAQTRPQWRSQPPLVNQTNPRFESVLLDVQDVLDNQSSQLRDGSRYRTYDIQGSAGQTVLIRMESQDFQTYLLVLNSAGTALAESNTRSDQSRRDRNTTEIQLTLPETGAYRVVANALDATGQGRFTLTVLASSPTIKQSNESDSSNSPCSGSAILSAATCEGDSLDTEETRLYELINAYRARAGLPPIPISPSLSRVANRHVRDLHENVGSLSNSWSNCPVEVNQSSTFACMWEAPQRLGTDYPGRAYENAAGPVAQGMRAEDALTIWQRSSPHNAVILNQGPWRTMTWQALGVGIYQGYAVIWFGEEVDPATRSHQWRLSN